MLAQWNDDLSVQQRTLDRDHENLLSIFNRLDDYLLENNDKKLILDVFGELVDAMSDHFWREEQIMRIVKYSGLPEHEAKHRYFERQLSILLYQFDIDQRKISVENLRVLGNLFLTHIVVDDRRMVQEVFSYSSIG
ncbi:hypothetical protein WCLP8_3940017 [uncultured Gammaproteobacteria bacterium]